MMSPLVEFKCVEVMKISQTPSDNIAKTNKDAIEAKLGEVIEQKKTQLSGVPGLNVESNCGGTAGGSGASSGSGTVCASCSGNAQATPSEGQTTNNGCTETNGGTIATNCGQFTGTGDTSGCTQSDSTQCTCGCDSCKNGKAGECCCFYKDTKHEEYDKKIKECLKNLAEKLSDKDIQCKLSGDSTTDCLMCYLCLLKHKMNELKDACNVTSGGGNGFNLNQTLQNLPKNIIAVVKKICGNTTTPAKACCEKCTNGKCSDNGNCKCNDDCCKVNDRFSNFTKFLLGTNSTTSSTETTNNCKTIAKTLTDLNTTLKTFVGENGARNGESNGCKCNSDGTDNCKNKCCCGSDKCSKNNGCKENKPISILSCVIECGLKGIKNRSENIVQHITKIVDCLNCIDKKMKCLKCNYDTLHESICKLGKCVKKDTDCLRGKICNLKTAKVDNQGKFNAVIKTSSAVLSDICGY